MIQKRKKRTNEKVPIYAAYSLFFTTVRHLSPFWCISLIPPLRKLRNKRLHENRSRYFTTIRQPASEPSATPTPIAQLFNVKKNNKHLMQTLRNSKRLMYTATRQVRSKSVVAQHQIPQRVVEI